MVKRKKLTRIDRKHLNVDCSLNEIIGEHLKKIKCGKILKLFEDEAGKTKKTKTMKRFFDFLKQKQLKNENTKHEDLGFEINFGAYQPSVSHLTFTEPKRSKKQEKQITEGECKKKKEIPKEFVEKIQKLGMKVEDADALYTSKIEWAAVYSENKVYCTEPGCDFYTKIDNGILTQHMIDRHKYGEYPCEHETCNFIGYSKKSLNLHRPMHTKLFEKEYWYKCPKPGCKSTCQDSLALDHHVRLHDNDLDVCSYCPYRYVKNYQYTRHLKLHFKIRDYKCDQCDLKFVTQTDINRHYQIHEGINYNCLICKTYEAHTKHNMESHLRSKHADIVGKNFTWNIVKHHVKIMDQLI